MIESISFFLLSSGILLFFLHDFFLYFFHKQVIKFIFFLFFNFSSFLLIFHLSVSHIFLLLEFPFVLFFLFFFSLIVAFDLLVLEFLVLFFFLLLHLLSFFLFFKLLIQFPFYFFLKLLLANLFQLLLFFEELGIKLDESCPLILIIPIHLIDRFRSCWTGEGRGVGGSRWLRFVTLMRFLWSSAYLVVLSLLDFFFWCLRTFRRISFYWSAILPVIAYRISNMGFQLS